jgi:hypothetical protein
MKAYIEFAEELSLRGRSLCDDLTAQGKVQRLGSGIGRVVYSHPKWPFLVFKYEFQPEPMSNQSEWDYWMRANDEQRQFLARPFYLSKNGHVIVMERVGKYTKDNPPPYNFYPAQVLNYMTTQTKYQHSGSMTIMMPSNLITRNAIVQTV